MSRGLVLLAALALALLVAEGALSLFGGVSLRDAWDEPSRAVPDPPTDEERRASSSGTFVVHEDPLVRYTLRPGSELRFVDAPAHTDASGQRVRPGAPPPADALRLLVLGDSVAFGYGVADHETLAAQLETLLAASRGPAARPLAAFTVGAPSWNHRTALHYLADHWDELRPDIVVYVPVANDLSDAAEVYDGGAQRLAPDPTSPDPWLLVSRSQLTSVEQRLAESWQRPALGAVALEADLSPESTRRYDENAASIVALHDLLAARGRRLVVIHSELYDYVWHLDARLRALRPELELLFIERFVPDSFKLPTDQHPNAETLHQRALAVARHLLERGWLDAGAGVPLPEASGEFASVLSQPGDLEKIAARHERSRKDALDKLRPVIDLATGEGFRQVFGGLNLDGTVRMHLLALLAAGGDALHVHLAPLTGRPDAYPLAVAVDIDGVPAGTLELRVDAPCDATLPLPPELARSGRPFEVRLRPARWVVVKDRGRSEVASCFLVRLDATPSD